MEIKFQKQLNHNNMTATIDINGRGVEITLTPEQETEVKRKAFDFKNIKTIEDVFSFLGMNYKTWLEQQRGWGREDNSIAYDECTYIAKALNGGSWLDGKDGNVPKYYPVHEVTSSGAGFSVLVLDGWFAASAVGAHLCVSDSQRTDYAGKQFIETYKRLKI